MLLVRASVAPVWAAVALILPTLSTGCGSGCDRTPSIAAVQYEGGDNPMPGFYESAPVTGPYLDFPGGRTYRFVHHLGGRPARYNAYFSFDEYPSSSGFVEASGNQATYTAVTPDYIDVRNDTCSDVRIRVVADDPILVSTGDAGP